MFRLALFLRQSIGQKPSAAHYFCARASGGKWRRLRANAAGGDAKLLRMSFLIVCAASGDVELNSSVLVVCAACRDARLCRMVLMVSVASGDASRSFVTVCAASGVAKLCRSVSIAGVASGYVKPRASFLIGGADSKWRRDVV